VHKVRAFLEVSVGKARQDIVSSLELPSLNNCSGFWAREIVPNHLASGPGMIRRGILPLGKCGSRTWLACISKFLNHFDIFPFGSM
jgi:hypothetical protein